MPSNPIDNEIDTDLKRMFALRDMVVRLTSELGDSHLYYLECHFCAGSGLRHNPLRTEDQVQLEAEFGPDTYSTMPVWNGDPDEWCEKCAGVGRLVWGKYAIMDRDNDYFIGPKAKVLSNLTKGYL